MTIEHKSITTRSNTYDKKCDTCGHVFRSGDLRHEWRLQFKSSYYLSGSFWTMHCEECFPEVLNIWRHDISDMLDNLEGMR